MPPSIEFELSDHRLQFGPAGGLAWFGLTERLSKVMALLAAPPPGVLTPLEQGMFALGYYHQLHDKFQGINARKAAAAARSAEPEPAINS